MFTCISAQQFVGVVLVVVARLSVAPLCHVRATAAVPCGILNAAGNKGAASCSLSVLDTRIVFVAAHLAAGQAAVERRTQDIVTIMERTQLQGAQAGEGAAAAAPAAAAEYVQLLDAAAGDGRLLCDACDACVTLQPQTPGARAAASTAAAAAAALWSTT